MSEVRTMRSRDLVRLCLRRKPKPGPAAAPSAPAARAPNRPATSWPVTTNASVDAAGCADHTTITTVESEDSSPPAIEEADSDPPSRRRLARHGTFAAALVLGGVALLGFSAAPAGAQEGGGDGGSSSSSSGDGGGMSSSGMSSSDGGMSSSSMSSSDGGMSSSDSSGMSSSDSSGGCCSSDSSMSSSFSSTDSSGGYGSTDSSATSSFSSSSYGSSDSSYGSTDTGVSTSESYGATTDSSYGSVSTETGYAGSPTGTTGFEGSPETGPAHAQAVNTDSSTYSGSTDSTVSAVSTDTSGTTAGISVSDSATSSFGADTVGATGFEGSSEVGPGHAAAVNANASSWSGETTSETAGETTGYAGSESGLTGFEGSPEVGPAHAEAVNTDASTWSAPVDATLYSGEISETGFTGFEGSPEVGPVHAQVVNADAPSWTGQIGETPAEAQAQAQAETVSYLTGFENSPELGPRLAQDMLAAELAGRFDASEVANRLSELGIDPNRFDPTQLRDLGLMSPTDPRYSQLVAAINTLAGQIESPLRGDDRIASPYATRAFETLDVEGTRALMGAINQLAFNRAWMGDPAPDVRTAMLDPVALGFSYATESPVAPVSVFEGLRALESRWQQHELSQLISAGFSHDPATGETTRVPGVSYDPSQLAQFANAITEFGRTHQMGIQPNASTIADPAFSGIYGLDALNTVVNPASLMFQGTEAWNGDVAMQVPEALALRALSINPDASWEYTGISPENLASVVRPTQNIIGYWGYTNPEVSQLKGLMDQYGANTVRGALVDAVVNDLSRYPTALDRYADVTRLMAQETPVSDPVRQSYVDVLGSYFMTPEGQLVGSYIDDIGQAALRQRETRYQNDAERMAQDFNRVDLMNAIRQAGMSEEAANTLRDVVTSWIATRAARFAEDSDLTRGEVETALMPSALLLDTIRQGLEDIAVPTENQQKKAEDIRYYGSLLAAGAGPAANLAGAFAKPVLSTGAGLLGSFTWAGSTYGAKDALAVSPTPFHGDDMARSVIGTLRESLANAVADREGVARPVPGEIQTTLNRAYPTVADPFGVLQGLSAQDGYLSQRRGTHWSH